MQHVSYWEAVERWMSADSTLRDAHLWGLRIVWWGRIGKFAAFLSGMVLILDIIGADRLRAFGERAARKARKRPPFIIFAMPVIGANLFGAMQASGDGWKFWEASVILIVLWVMATLATIYQHEVVGWIVQIYERDKLAVVIRSIALLLLVVGFHFDMLSS